MAGVAVSVDVWDTLIRLSAFYAALARALAQLLGRDEGAVEAALRRSRARIKSLRAAGGIDPRAVVDECVGILAGELGCPREAVRRGVAKAVAELDGEGLAYEDAVEALEAFASRGVPVVALSNVMFWPGSLTRVVVEKAGVARALAAQVYADEVKCLKPHPRIFATALSLLGADSRRSVHVGDSPFEDLAGALAAEMGAVLVERRGGRGILLADQRIAVVGSLGEVPGAVKALLGSNP